MKKEFNNAFNWTIRADGKGGNEYVNTSLPQAKSLQFHAV